MENQRAKYKYTMVPWLHGFCKMCMQKRKKTMRKALVPILTSKNSGDHHALKSKIYCNSALVFSCSILFCHTIHCCCLLFVVVVDVTVVFIFVVVIVFVTAVVVVVKIL